MADPKAAVTHLVVTVGEKKFELTLAEAKALKKILNETLEPTVTYPVHTIERTIEKEVPNPWREPWSVQPYWRQGDIVCHVVPEALMGPTGTQYR